MPTLILFSFIFFEFIQSDAWDSLSVITQLSSLQVFAYDIRLFVRAEWNTLYFLHLAAVNVFYIGKHQFSCFIYINTVCLFFSASERLFLLSFSLVNRWRTKNWFYSGCVFVGRTQAYSIICVLLTLALLLFSSFLFFRFSFYRNVQLLNCVNTLLFLHSTTTPSFFALFF